MNLESTQKEDSILCQGSCHCGRVKIAVKVPVVATISKCNCSICAKSGHMHLIVAKEDFEILQGRDGMTEYRFNTGTARHLFCSHCGVKPFYVPRSHPDYYSVNIQCLTLDERIRLSVKDFDGLYWEKNIEELLGEQ